jgi:hypothetical protein
MVDRAAVYADPGIQSGGGSGGTFCKAAGAAHEVGGLEMKRSSFFEKKEPKKLLLSGHGLDRSGPWRENKSLLLLFFRKEVLSFGGFLACN